MSEPVHFDEKEKAWFFWDETGAYRMGPFASEIEARAGLKQYVEEYLNGEDTDDSSGQGS